MPKTVSVQSSFTSGELSPTLKGRYTLAQYDNGCETLQNMVVMPQGGVTKRPGTKFIAAVKDSADHTILLPFIAGQEDSYALEFGDGYIRFYREDGYLAPTSAITNGTFASNLDGWTAVHTGTGTSTQTGGVMRLSGGAGGSAYRYQALNYLGIGSYQIQFTSSTNTCTYGIGTTNTGTQIITGTSSIGTNTISFTITQSGRYFLWFRNTANNNADVDNVSYTLLPSVYELSTDYTSAMLDDIQWAQAKDVLYLAHPEVRLTKVRRFGASQWDIVGVDLVDGPYYNKTDDTYGGVGTDIAISPTATTGSVTVTATGPIFSSTDVGRALRYRPNTASDWAELTITAYTDTQTVTAEVQKTLAGTGASTEWRLGYFSDTTGHPACVTFHEQRLVLANTTDRPQTVWFSRAGDVEVFQPDNDTYRDEVDATSAMTYTIASRNNNSISWLSSRDVLFLGSQGAIFTAKASSLDEALTPNNISIKPTVRTMAYKTMPIETTSATLFIHYHQRKLMELAYNPEQDSMIAVDLSILSSHLGTDGLKKMVRQEEPYSVLWAMTEEGNLLSLTYVRDQNVVGWASHVIGGTDAKVKSIIAIPGKTETDIWMIVERTVNGSSVKYIEKMSRYFREGSDDLDAAFTDSHIVYSGVSTASISGLSHLESEDVSVLANGYVGVVSDPVTAGAITLQSAATYAVIGFPYTAIVKTMPISLKESPGGVVGSLTRAWKSFVRLYRSALLRVGYSSDDSNIVENFSDGYVMGGSVPLFSGIKEIPYDHGAELEIATYIEQDDPVPLMVLSIGTKMVVDDDR